jgi:CTP:phosphocholine cytidylyltransferase-like protein
MKSKYIVLIILGGILEISLSVVLFFFSPWIFGFDSYITYDDPPAITYAEFPFEITYMLEGKLITIEDVYVCEYKGWLHKFDYSRREWKGYMKSTQEEYILVVDHRENRKVVCIPGSPGYFMGDETYYSYDEPTLLLLQYEKDGIYTEKLTRGWEEYYDVSLVSWTIADPIENSFE